MNRDAIFSIAAVLCFLLPAPTSIIAACVVLYLYMRN